VNDVAATLAAMLDGETLARRIAAARELRGMEQAELGRRMESEYGFGKHDAARAERKNPKAPAIGAGRRHALATILGVPEVWFTASDADLFTSIAGSEAPLRSRLGQLEAEVAELRAHMLTDEQIAAVRDLTVASDDLSASGSGHHENDGTADTGTTAQGAP
jgi:transcriptional regulator with XRE-family HTH domain